MLRAYYDTGYNKEILYVLIYFSCVCVYFDFKYVRYTCVRIIWYDMHYHMIWYHRILCIILWYDMHMMYHNLMYVWYAYIWYHRYHIDCDIHRFIIFTKIFLLHSITSYELRRLFFLLRTYEYHTYIHKEPLEIHQIQHSNHDTHIYIILILFFKIL